MSKRKRDILDGFDPNKSDSDDENFEPGEDRPRRANRASRTPGRPKNRSLKRARYKGSDIDEDGEEVLSDSEEDNSYGDNDREQDEDEDEDAPMNAAGRKARKAATARISYREDSEDEVDDIEDSESDRKPVQPKKPKSRIVVLKTSKLGRPETRSRRSEDKKPPTPLSATFPGTRRSTRARTEDQEELVELSTSGRHARPARSSQSRSPETMSRNARPTRATKGLKKPPAPIQEATQESSSYHHNSHLDTDELAANTGLNDSAEDDDVEEHVGEAADDEDAAGDVGEEAAGEGQGDGGEPEPAAAADDDDDDDMPVTRRSLRNRGSISQAAQSDPAEEDVTRQTGGRRLTRKSKQQQKSAQEPSSDFEPGDDSAEGDGDESMGSAKKGRNSDPEDESSSPLRRGRRSRQQSKGPKRKSRRGQESGDEDLEELDKDEMAEELEELRQSSRSRLRRRRRSTTPIRYEEPKRRRVTKAVDYSIKAIDPAFPVDEDDDEPAPTPARRGGRGRPGAATGWERSFNTTHGPFGGGGGAGALLKGPWGAAATGGVDSDSSDDEMGQRSGMGGAVGMTPTSAVPPGGGLLPGVGQPLNLEGLGGVAATPNVGKVKNQKALADADPLGVDVTVDFSKVGGLQGHIDQLKEMVQLPLLYPELFLKFHVTPPRGVLFHGPPGTGKTLLARALANSVGHGGRKISFYMRKGADALSKWVGEAEKQLRLLFEEARRTQPSIIFFDEIDGLAPVRSSKQEQIHASIVSTLLALMDGMDGRGQVIVIGATNRPDNIDPALRRPGRFDREFYFPLPDKAARRSILDIHTKDWGLSEAFRDALAERTKGYGGADLRALATEAALNAIQRTYPQIYTAPEKLVVNPDRITVQATDFMLSMKKMVPSSERSATSAATSIPKGIEPLLRNQFKAAVELVDEILPRKKKVTALEEAMFEPFDDDDHGFGREQMLQEFDRARVYRPRLLLGGKAGMGQEYIASAVLHQLEGVHVQNMDLANVMGDGRPIEQVIVGLFAEAKRRKPSILFIPNVDAWYDTVGPSALSTFRSMLRSIAPTEAIMVLCTAEVEPNDLPEDIVKDLFPFSRKNKALIERPSRAQRQEFFQKLVAHVQKSPNAFPDPANRKKRVLEELPIAPPPPPKAPTKAEAKAQHKADLHALNILKTRLQPIMDQINRKYKKFRQPVIQYSQVQYLFDELDPNYVRPDVSAGQIRPYEIAQDREGTDGLQETGTGKFFYNLETTTIEERLSNGFYSRPRDFYRDIERLAKDAKNIGDKERTLKANELVTNVEVDIHDIEIQLSNVNWEELHQRQVRRTKEQAEKAKKRAAMRNVIGIIQSDLSGDVDSDSQGPVRIGAAVPGPHTTAARFQVMSPRPTSHVGESGSGSGPASHGLTNGSSVPSRMPGDEDVHMGGVEELDTQGTNGTMRPPAFLPRDLASQQASGTRYSGAGAGAGGALSQLSAVTSVPPGVSPSAMVNEASTTRSTNTSSKNLSNESAFTNGVHHASPTGTGAGAGDQGEQPLSQASQLPDTQPGAGASGPSQTPSSGKPWPHSQAHGLQQGVLHQPTYAYGGGGSGGGGEEGGGGRGGDSGKTSPTSSQLPLKPFEARSHFLAQSAPGSTTARSAGVVSRHTPLEAPPTTAIAAIVNPSNSDSSATSEAQIPASLRNNGGLVSSSERNSNSSQQYQRLSNEEVGARFLKLVVDETSGATIEQLEQINRDLMDEVWRTRGEWNRTKVVTALTGVFNDTIKDIELCQGRVRPSSQEDAVKSAVQEARSGDEDDAEDLVEIVAHEEDEEEDDEEGERHTARTVRSLGGRKKEKEEKVLEGWIRLR